MSNELLTSAAAERNKDPILTAIETVLPESARVLEIASGTGQHVCFFAAGLPKTRWQPTEPDAAHLDAIRSRIRESGLANIDPPLALDVHQARWPVGEFDAVVCINMIHIAPWSATAALCAGAARHLSPLGKLILYGPYLENGTAVRSNLDFDTSLKRRNPDWGLRDLDVVTKTAATHGFTRERIVRMPANNLTVVFTRDQHPPI